MNSAPESLLNHLREAIPNANLVATVLPQCSSVSLWLLDPHFPQWDISHEQAATIMESPPFWSFCWASGQVLARHFLANPDIVRNKSVVDFGAGSGVVGIAAKLAGADRVVMCDADPVALEASRCNASLNDVTLEYSDSLESLSGADLVTIADVFYDRDNLPLLDHINKHFNEVWVADSRLKGEPLDKLSIVGQFESFTVPDLAESSEFNRVNLYASETYASKTGACKLKGELNACS